MSSPCIDVCRYDEVTRWCLGCGMTRKDKRHWRRDPARRPEILAALPGRLESLAACGLETGERAAAAEK